jgi:hypothetical protein
MTNDQYDEKELRKQEEKSSEEKSFEEKREADPVGAMVWAATLIWAGVVLLLVNFNLLGDFTLWSPGWWPDEAPVTGDAWSLFFLGAAVLVLIGVAARLLIPSYRRPVMGSVIWALILVGLAIGNWGLIWPIILIGIGLSLLLGGFLRR